MRICVDARKIADFGIGQYIQNLLPAMLSLSEEFSLHLILDPNTPKSLIPQEDRVRVFHLRAKVYSLKEQGLIPWACVRMKPDVLHVPHYNIPVLSTVPMVATVHDLIHLRFSGQVPSFLARAYALVLFRILPRRCRKIIAISRCTARDLQMFAHANPGKIRTIPYGRDERFSRFRNEPSLELPQVGREEPVLLVVGNCKPHKNVEILLDAMAQIPEPRPFKLVVAGGGFSDRSRLGARAVVNRVNKDLVFLGAISHEKVPGLYRRATALLFPSLYEGFGLPPLEAMSSGCPVVCSTAASIPEVVGDAAFPLSPTDVAGWRDAMLRIVSEQPLRKELSEKGKKRAERFSWTLAAEATFQVYREVVEGRGS